MNNLCLVLIGSGLTSKEFTSLDESWFQFHLPVVLPSLCVIFQMILVFLADLTHSFVRASRTILPIPSISSNTVIFYHMAQALQSFLIVFHLDKLSLNVSNNYLTPSQTTTGWFKENARIFLFHQIGCTWKAKVPDSQTNFCHLPLQLEL